MDPQEPCQNPDYQCPTPAERKAANTQRSVQKQKERVESDPEFKKQIADRQKDYYEQNKEKISKRQKESYLKNRSKRLESQAERRRKAALALGFE